MKVSPSKLILNTDVEGGYHLTREGMWVMDNQFEWESSNKIGESRHGIKNDLINGKTFVTKVKYEYIPYN